jgi:hypothetical protein
VVGVTVDTVPRATRGTVLISTRLVARPRAGRTARVKRSCTDRDDTTALSAR